MSKQADIQRMDDYRVEGAYSDLNRLVELHRFSGRLQMDARGARVSDLAGPSRQLHRGRGVDFDEVRLYQPGDDIRSIDWRVTARTCKPHTKLFREERERPALLAADLRSPMFFGTRHCFKSVYCASLISSLAWAALSNGDRVGGLVFGDTEHRDLRPKRSKHQVLALIRHLDSYCHRLQTPCPSTPPQPLIGLLDNLCRICRPGASLVIASDFHDLDEGCRERLYQLTRHADLTLFVIEDRMEQRLPDRPGLWVTDGVGRRPLAGEPVPVQRTQQLETLDRLCGELKIGCHWLRTDEPLIERLHELYGPGRRRS